MRCPGGYSVLLLTNRRFRWVELQLNTFFSAKSRIKRRDAFQRKLVKIDEEVGSPLLDDVYNDIYQMNTPEPEDRRVAERALLWLMCCQKLVSIEMLVEAASLDSDGEVDDQVDADYLLDICSNFIIVDHNELVQFAHLSVREYLMNSTTHGYTMAHANPQAARTCLLHLLGADVEDNSDEADEEKSQVLRYAFWWWAFHCSEASVDRGATNPVQDLLGNFLNPTKPSDGFIKCLDIWQAAIDKSDFLGKLDVLNKQNDYDLLSFIWCSVNPDKSPFFAACAWGFSEVIQTALSHGSSWDDRNFQGDTALTVGVNMSNIEIVRLLLDNGADIDAVGAIGNVFLHARHRPLELVKLLVERGADISKPVQGLSGSTRLHVAVAHNQEDVVRFLLANGADANVQDCGSLTPLHAASSSKNTTIIELLLGHGADADLKDDQGKTTLQRAAGVGNEAVVRLLLAHQGLESESEKLLRETRFHSALYSGDEDTVLSMLEEGDDIYVEGVRTETPLHWAVQNGRPQVIPVLLQKGADIDALDNRDQTPLARACVFGYVDMVYLLLDHGADIHLEQGDEEGNKCSILSLVAFSGMLEMVQLLLKLGADPRSVNLDLLEQEKVEDSRIEYVLEALQSHLVDRLEITDRDN